MRKSKFYSMIVKDRKKVKQKTENKTLDLAVDDLLLTVQDTDKVIQTTDNNLDVNEFKSKTVEVDQPIMKNKKAYNIWKDEKTKNFILDIIEYSDDKIISISSKIIANNEPMAIYEIKKIFTEKLILKKQNI